MKISSKLVQIFLLDLLKNPLLYMGLLLISLNLVSLLTPLKAAATYFDLGISMGVIVFLFNEKLMSLAVMTCLLLLYANLPFKNDLQLSLIIRSSTSTWFVAQIGYVFLLSIGYPIILLLLSGLVLWQQVELTHEWGKLLGSIAYYPSLLEEFSIFLYPSNGVMTTYTPLEAILFTLTLLMLVSLFAGVLILTFNLIYSGLGFAIYAVLMFVEFSLMFFPGYAIKYFSPLSWLSLERISLSFMDNLPSMTYVVTFLVVSIITCLLAIFFLLKSSRFRERVINE